MEETNHAETEKKDWKIHLFFKIRSASTAKVLVILLMAEISNNHLGFIKPVVNHGIINYQPQLVSSRRISQPSTQVEKSLLEIAAFWANYYNS